MKDKKSILKNVSLIGEIRHYVDKKWSPKLRVEKDRFLAKVQCELIVKGGTVEKLIIGNSGSMFFVIDGSQFPVSDTFETNQEAQESIKEKDFLTEREIDEYCNYKLRKQSKHGIDTLMSNDIEDSIPAPLQICPKYYSILVKEDEGLKIIHRPNDEKDMVQLPSHSVYSDDFDDLFELAVRWSENLMKESSATLVFGFPIAYYDAGKISYMLNVCPIVRI